MNNSSIITSNIEMTSGNYDENANLICNEVPTITTNLCEIGAYENTCYFTIIIESESFSKSLFESLTKYSNVHIYGYERFHEDYYPKQSCRFEDIRAQVCLEQYAQIQFDFDVSALDISDVFSKYKEVSNLFGELSIKVVNQRDQ